VALLGMVYLQSTVYLTRRVDGILRVEANALAASPPAELPRLIDDALALNGAQINIYGLFSSDGRPLAGNLRALPPRLQPGGPPVETPPSRSFPANARLIALALPSGRTLVVGRDVNQLREMRSIIASALAWTGPSILLIGLGLGVAFSIAPLRRLRLMQAAARDIAAGDLKRRMPISQNRDELDMFASTVNYMMGEVERLMTEVKSASDTIAHDLRTPLTRARAQLHRLQQTRAGQDEDIDRIIGEIDSVLARFRALLRISELEARERRAGFTTVDLSEIARQAVDLYLPLAETEGVQLRLRPTRPVQIEADPKLLFEAVSNLLDNAIKFTAHRPVPQEPAPQAKVEVSLVLEGQVPQIVVRDNGPGIPERERSAVLQRFYRAEDKRLIAGSGLGLSIVAAIMRLHRFTLEFHDAEPGLKAVIVCHPPHEGSAEGFPKT
jgi:signal transduction histidine kinase